MEEMEGATFAFGGGGGGRGGRGGGGGEGGGGGSTSFLFRIRRFRVNSKNVGGIFIIQTSIQKKKLNYFVFL